MDSLSSILESIRLSSSIFCKAELHEPWSVHTNSLPNGIFHAVVEGECTLQLEEDQSETHLKAGDVIFLPHGHSHVMNAPAGTPPVPIASKTTRSNDGTPSSLRIEGLGNFTYLLCGSFVLERSEVHPLFTLLPSILHISPNSEEERQWFLQTLSLLRMEVERPGPGAQILLTRLADVLMVRALRTYIDKLKPGHGGWLRGLQDPQVSQAISLMHSSPCEPWTAKSLAQRVGMSRSGFFARFSELVGLPPKQYLTQWRIHLATQSLKGQSSSVAEIAFQVGYSSESSFSKAFKRLLGIAPTEYRRSFVMT